MGLITGQNESPSMISVVSEQLLSLYNRPASKANNRMIAGLLIQRPEWIYNALALMHTSNSPIVSRIAWSLSDISDLHPELLNPHTEALTSYLLTNPSSGICRNLLRIIEKYPIQEPYWLPLFEQCLQWVKSDKTPVAVRCNAMTVAYRIGDQIPELLQELQLVIKDHLAFGSKGFTSRAAKTLAMIEKNNNSRQQFQTFLSC
jgi:uncharacterized protein YbaR (Trm112 family)